MEHGGDHHQPAMSHAARWAWRGVTAAMLGFLVLGNRFARPGDDPVGQVALNFVAIVLEALPFMLLGLKMSSLPWEQRGVYIRYVCYYGIQNPNKLSLILNNYNVCN